MRQITCRPEGGEEDIRLFTTLLDPGEISKDELARLYHDRWEEETIMDEIKTHLCDCATVNRAVTFRSKTPDRVEQELYGMLIAYDAVRKTMAEAARTVQDPSACGELPSAGSGPELVEGSRGEVSPRRLSFTASLERIREAVRDMMQLPTSRLPARYARMLKAIARARVPERPGRHYPRAVKIKMSSYPLKRRNHAAQVPGIESKPPPHVQSRGILRAARLDARGIPR